MNLKNTILFCSHPSKLKLNQIDSIMKKYKFCVIRGIVNLKDLKDAMKKLKIFIKKNKDLPAIGEDFWVNFFKNKNDFNIVLSETSVTEISKKNTLRYFMAQFLKSISKFEFYLKINKLSLPKWPFVGGWDLIVRKND